MENIEMSEEQRVAEFERQEREYLRLKEQKESARELVEMLGKYVNYRKSSKEFIDAFKREHRTLQQSAFKMLLELMEEMATEDYRTDGRNESTKKVAQTLLEGFKMAKIKEYESEGVSKERAENYVSGEGSKPSKYLPLI